MNLGIIMYNPNIVIYVYIYIYIVLYGYIMVISLYCVHKSRWILQIYKYIEKDVEKISDTSNYQLECNSIKKALPKWKKNKVIGLMKDELWRKVTIKFVGLRA